MIPGARVGAGAEEVVAEVKGRLGDQPPEWITSDEPAASESALVTALSEAELAPSGPRRPGRPRGGRLRRCARSGGRVGSLRRSVVLGDERAVEGVLKASVGSRTIPTSLVERRPATDRGQSARKARRTDRFSRDGQVHEAMTFFMAHRDTLCWPMRTLRTKGEAGRWRQRTPAMAAGLADHEWSLEEWISFPAIQCN